MTSEQVFHDLKIIMSKLLKITVSEIDKLATPESDLREIGIDSVESLDLLHNLEDHYLITISDVEAGTLEKVKDVIQLILSKQTK